MTAIRRAILALQSTSIGGMETHVIDLAAEYARRGIDVTLVVPEAPAFDPLALRGTAAGARVCRLDTDARGGRVAQVRRAPRIARLLRAARPDVVHLHTGGATGGLALLAMARTLTAATVAITEHDVPSEHPGRKQRLARRAMDRSCHVVVAVSRRNARLRHDRLPVRRPAFAAVLNGVPVPALSPAEQAENRVRVRDELGIPAGATVIGSLVRLAEGKGLDTLIRAFALTRAAAPCELLLVGDGPLRAELQALALSLGVADHVRFAGNQPQPAPYLDGMDAFALAVPAGSMSIALLEAMARGLPPVITFCGPEEAVIPGETGLGAAPNDPAALAAALTTLAADSATRERLALAARAHVERHFSVSRVAGDLLTAYAAAKHGTLPARLRFDTPPNPRPGDAPIARDFSPAR